MFSVLCRRSSHALFSLFFCATFAAAATSSNRTIDDQDGDSVTGQMPVYSPSGSWTQGASCSGCFIHLDTADVFHGTWHDTTHSPSDTEPRVITAQFTGTAVYVFNVLANTVPYTTTFTSLTFALDGTQVGTFVHNPTTSTDFQYDVNVFTKTGLANQEHTLVITAGGDVNSSLVLFDYIVYTFEEEDPPTTTVTATTTQAQPTTTTTSTTSTSSSTSATSPSTSTGTTGGSSSTGTATSSDSSAGLQNSSANSSSTPSQTSSSSESDGAAPASQTGGALSAQDNASSTTPVGAIAGGVAGGVIALAVFAGLLFFFCRRRSRAQRIPDDPTEQERFWGASGGAQSRFTQDVGFAHGGSFAQSGGFAQGGSLVQNGSSTRNGDFAQTGGFTQSGANPAHRYRDSAYESDVMSSSNASSYQQTYSHHSPQPSTEMSSVSPYTAYATVPVSSPHAYAGAPTPTSAAPLAPLRRIPEDVPHSPGASADAHSPLAASDVSHLHDPAPYTSLAAAITAASASASAYPPPPASTVSCSAASSSGGRSGRSLPRTPPTLALIPGASGFPADEKARLRALEEIVSSIPVPPVPEEPVRARSPGAASTATGIATLRDQVALLQEEIARLREQQEMQSILDEAPPQYVEA